jgi:hypothetical protein
MAEAPRVPSSYREMVVPLEYADGIRPSTEHAAWTDAEIAAGQVEGRDTIYPIDR